MTEATTTEAPGPGDPEALALAWNLERLCHDWTIAHLCAAEMRRLTAENERLRGLKPECPPRPPHNNDASHQHPALPRYGLRWNGPSEPVSVPMPDGYWTPFHVALEAVKPATALAELIAHHASLLETNSYAYFELAYTRRTGWMAWITDKPAKGEPGTAEYARSRTVIARGQGDTPEEAAADALAAMTQAPA